MAEKDLQATLWDYDAVRLFMERALDHKPDLTFHRGNALAMVEICQRLDGIPLAIELTAARVHALSVEQIAARLNAWFQLLTQSSNTTLPRHQTLQATLDWSYELLNASEQSMLHAMAIFAGGWTLEAVEAVAQGSGIGMRYRLLVTVQQYAWDRLPRSGEAEAVREQIRAPILSHAQEEYRQTVADVRRTMGEEAFLTAWAQGRTLGLNQNFGPALS